MNFFSIQDGALIFKRRKETLRITGWGENSLRVRATQNPVFTDNDWALTMPAEHKAEIEIADDYAVISNGKIKARINIFGKIKFFNQKDELILNEYYRSVDHGGEPKPNLDQVTALRKIAREFKGTASDNYAITARFEPNDGERFFGMGQYQQPYLDLKGCILELAQKNTQASVPFLISNLGYGFLWNNPAIGSVSFGKNLTEWHVQSSKQLDYWITAGDTPAEIEETYAKVTGTTPIMPDYAMGFWQCKLRYRTQEELLNVAREYHKKKIPVKVIVVDFFHWPNQGDWMFDTDYWPDPEGMIRELNEMGMKLMVSVWPTIEPESCNYKEMAERNLLIRTDRGAKVMQDCFGLVEFIDTTNPETQDFIWQACKKNYFDKGVSLFWLDEAEPEYSNPDFDIYRYHIGSALECANVYPVTFAKAFYDGQRMEGVENPISLIRCAWAGSQRYGALAWSGDIPSTFGQLRNQVCAGLNMGLAGIPWWNSDIGGFHSGNVNDPYFHELLARWFEFGTFCPVMRLHGDRTPRDKTKLGPKGGGSCSTGGPNEIWSFTPQLEEIMTKYILLRDRMQPYISAAMTEAHEKGTPVIKPLFYDFPTDEAAWKVEDAYLFGHDLLVAPVTEEGETKKSVYLPAGATWTDAWTKRVYEGGQTVTVNAPLEMIPLFVRDNDGILKLLNL
ncbi:MAG TPA: glycoside hydrolase family 31 protein [Oscillospiraceae bacterium]|nr:glycoside hydrolase family 31 protein [Oscillospiraceae bacterium]HPF55587.1 glycoside hydrolase family 31 protein [Clostridiales bacterium]HPK35822.1 glycoside hydrolase family 31 protein [Oscillospiraceae bacterium]HPR76340.1 glycoside hydrolase family 31 protein [Oscillospiraceae bacterium]